MRTVKKDYILHVRVPADVYNYVLFEASRRKCLKSAVVLDMLQSYIRADNVFSALSSFNYDSETSINDQL